MKRLTLLPLFFVALGVGACDLTRPRCDEIHLGDDISAIHPSPTSVDGPMVTGHRLEGQCTFDLDAGTWGGGQWHVWTRPAPLGRASNAYAQGCPLNQDYVCYAHTSDAGIIDCTSEFCWGS